MTPDQLEPDARAELRTLPSDLADGVARRLVAAELEEDPERAYAHARVARDLAARVGVVRETVGVAAYRVGKWPRPSPNCAPRDGLRAGRHTCR